MRQAMRNGEDRRRVERILDSHLRRAEQQQRISGTVSEQIDRDQVAHMLSQHLQKKMSSAREQSQSIDRAQVAAMLTNHLQSRMRKCKVPAFGEVDASRTDRKKVAEILSQHLRTKIQVARSQQADKEARDSRREEVKGLLESMLKNHLAPKEPLRSRSTKSATKQRSPCSGTAWCSAEVKQVVKGGKQEKEATIPSDFVAMDAKKRMAVSAALERFLRQRLSKLTHNGGKKATPKSTTQQQNARCASVYGAAVQRKTTKTTKTGEIPSDFVVMDRRKRKNVEKVLERFLAERLAQTQRKASAASPKPLQLSEATFRAKVSGQPWMCGDGAMVYLGPDGTAQAFDGASRWRVSEVRQREVTVERSARGQPFRLYFNPAVSGFYCPERSLQAFALGQGWTGPAHAAAPSAAPLSPPAPAPVPPPPPPPSDLGPFPLEWSVRYSLEHTWQPATVDGHPSWVQVPHFKQQCARSDLLAAIRRGTVLKVVPAKLSTACPPPPPMPRELLVGATGPSSLAASRAYVLEDTWQPATVDGRRFRWSDSGLPMPQWSHSRLPKLRWTPQPRSPAPPLAGNKSVRRAAAVLLAALAAGKQRRAAPVSEHWRAYFNYPSDFVPMDPAVRKTVAQALNWFFAQRLAKMQANAIAAPAPAQTAASAQASESALKAPRDFVAMEVGTRRHVEKVLERVLAERLATLNRQHKTKAAKTLDAPPRRARTSSVVSGLGAEPWQQRRNSLPASAPASASRTPRIPAILAGSAPAFTSTPVPSSRPVLPPALLAAIREGVALRPTGCYGGWYPQMPRQLLAAINAGVALRPTRPLPGVLPRLPLDLQHAIHDAGRVRTLAFHPRMPRELQDQIKRGLLPRAVGAEMPRVAAALERGCWLALQLARHPRLPAALQQEIRDARFARSSACVGHAQLSGDTALAEHPRKPQELQDQIKRGLFLRPVTERSEPVELMGWIITPETNVTVCSSSSESSSLASEASEPEELEDGVLAWD